MKYSIALNFEDGVTRFIDCNEDEKVLDAAYRQQINLPMDCADGVCGTCKCRADSGEYELNNDYIEDALTDEEAEEGLVLTCQMIPKSDCVITVPTASTMCKTGTQTIKTRVKEIRRHDDAAYELLLESDGSTSFLPGQYVNIKVPGSTEDRSYSFSSAPGNQMSFLIKHVPNGLMSSWLQSKAADGDELELTGPMGTFYLRAVNGPVLFLAGGTGLAPFLSMLEILSTQNCEHPIHLLYAVTRDQDLVLLEALEAYKQKLANFSFDTIVADEASSHPRKGYVTHHLAEEMLHDGKADVYLCGPPPMVDAVNDYLEANNFKPANLYYERFIPSV